MKSLIVLITLLVTLAGFSASAVFNDIVSVSDSNIPDNEITTSQNEASNSLASATITITMYAVPDE